MHAFTGHRPQEKSWRFFAYFDLPTNPICWLFGHRAAVEVVEPKYSEPYRLVRCRICDLRYSADPGSTHSLLSSKLAAAARERGGLTARELHELERDLAKELSADQVDFARRDPKAVAASCSGRTGYGVRTINLNAEFSGPRPWAKVHSAGFRIHTGTRSSETPLHLSLDLGFVAAYLSIGGIGGRWCEFIGRGQGRDISLQVHNGSLWWKGWYDDDGGHNDRHRCDSWRTPPWPWSLGRRKYRPWMCLRDGHIALNPADAWWGSPKGLHDEKGPWREAIVDVGQFDGDHYLVKFRREPYEVRREHGPAWARRVLRRGVHLEWDARPAGIPIRNHDWKGDETLAGTMSMPDVPEGSDWLTVAVDTLVGHIRSDRERYGYRPPVARAEAGS